MKFKMIVFLFAIPLCLFAQKKDMSGLPGNARFDELKDLRSYGKVTKIYLDQNVFKMIDFENTEDGEELQSLLRPLKMIVLYTIRDVKRGKADSLRLEFGRIDSSLISRGWERLMTTDEEKEMTTLYLRHSEGHRVVGLAVTSIKRSNATLVNIIGDNIDMSTIGKIGHKFKLPALENNENDD